MKTTSKLTSKALKLAHKIRAKFQSWGDALRKAWMTIKLKVKLRLDHSTCFTFIKKDGTERMALGHNKKDHHSYQFKTSGKPKPLDLIRYFDQNKNMWRSFRAHQLHAIHW